MNWNFFVSMAIGFVESAGVALKSQDANETGSDDLVGDGLIYSAKFLRWLISDRKKPAPEVPTSVKK